MECRQLGLAADSGHQGLELDSAGKITRFTAIYDSNQFTDAKYDALVSLASELPPSP